MTEAALFIAASLAGNALNYLFQILSVHRLTTTEFSSFQALLSLFTIVAVPVGTLGWLITKRVASTRCGSARIQAASRPTLVALGILALIELPLLVFADFLGFQIGGTSAEAVRWFLLSVLTNVTLVGAQALLMGCQNFRAMGLITILLPLGKIATLLACTSLLGGLHAGLLALAIPNLLVTFAVGIWAHKCNQDSSQQEPRGVSESISYDTINSLMANLALAILCQVDILWMNRTQGANVTAPYAVAALFGRTLVLIPAALSQMMLPRIAATKDVHERQRLFWRFTSSGVALSLVGFLGIFILGRPLLSLLFGESGRGALEFMTPVSLLNLALNPLQFVFSYRFARGDRRLAPCALAMTLLATAVLFGGTWTILHMISLLSGTAVGILVVAGFDRNRSMEEKELATRSGP